MTCPSEHFDKYFNRSEGYRAFVHKHYPTRHSPDFFVARRERKQIAWRAWQAARRFEFKRLANLKKNSDE